MLTEAQMVDCRRHMGYQAVGTIIPITDDTDIVYAQFGMITMSLHKRLTTLNASEETVLLSYITKCNELELAITTASDNLDTDEAAVWKHNKNEVNDRAALYTQWRVRLCAFLGFPVGKGVTPTTSVRLARA